MLETCFVLYHIGKYEKFVARKYSWISSASQRDILSACVDRRGVIIGEIFVLINLMLVQT